MKIGASSGDSVEFVALNSSPGLVSVSLNNAVEILGCGLKDGNVVLFCLIKEQEGFNHGKRVFMIQPIGKELPIDNWKYYFYVGMIVKKGWAVFEVI